MLYGRCVALPLVFLRYEYERYVDDREHVTAENNARVVMLLMMVMMVFHCSKSFSGTLFL